MVIQIQLHHGISILHTLLGQCKPNAAAKVALREGVSAQDMADNAADIFSLQTSTPDADIRHEHRTS